MTAGGESEREREKRMVKRPLFKLKLSNGQAEVEVEDKRVYYYPPQCRLPSDHVDYRSPPPLLDGQVGVLIDSVLVLGETVFTLLFRRSSSSSSLSGGGDDDKLVVADFYEDELESAGQWERVDVEWLDGERALLHS